MKCWQIEIEDCENKEMGEMYQLLSKLIPLPFKLKSIKEIKESIRLGD